jgi:FtsZ-binding cell division protein ZapB
MKTELDLWSIPENSITKWYKPQTEEEVYLLEVLSRLQVNFDTLTTEKKALDDEVSDLKIDNDKLEDINYDLTNDNIELEKMNTVLENKVDEYEYIIDDLTKKLENNL